MVEYRLPLPPSSNNAYFNLPNGGRAPTSECKKFKRDAQRELELQDAKPFGVRAIVHIDISETECGSNSDAANREKLVTDALVEAGILKNDSKPYVQRVSIGFEPITGCRVRLEAA